MPRVAILVALLSACACSGNGTGSKSDPAAAAVEALRRGQLAEAERVVERGLSGAASDSSAAVWRLRLIRGEILLARRDLAGATEISRASLPEGPSYQVLRVRQQYLRARIAYSQGHLPEALALASAALTDAPPGDEIALDIGGFVGQLTLQQGHWADGEARLERILSDAAATRNTYIEALAATSLGMGKFIRNRCDEALPQFERVLSLTAIAETVVYARALYNAGMCYARIGRFDKAAEVQRRAVSASETRPASEEFERALGSLGNTYLLQGNTTDGLAFMQRAYKAASDAHNAADAALWSGNLAKAYIDLRQWDEAERFNEAAKQLALDSRTGRPIYNIENSAAIAAGRGQLDEATRLYEEVLASRDAPPSVLWPAHFGMANVAAADSRPAVASRHFEAALEVIERARASLLRDDYKISYLTQLIAFYRGYVDVLIAQGHTDRALEIADSSRGQLLAARQSAAAPQRATVTAFQALARKTRMVFLSYWLGPDRSYLWVVDAKGAAIVTLPRAADIEALVREHAASIANVMVNPLAAKDTAGDKLFQLLVQPAARWLSPGASVVIVPDGALSSINFETLPVDGAARHYWIEDVEVQIAPSLASIAAGTATTDSGSLLLIGNPSPRPPEFPALRAAPQEMADIAGHFGAGRVSTFEGGRASPAAYRDAQPGRFAYVHFTAHAVTNSDSPLDSAVILSGPDGAFKLYARDVAALPLTAELVTVSACRSAGERAYSGEGLVGFSWAFLRAGARRVIAGLWDVDDQSTAALMDRLYAGLAAGDPPVRALRRAKLAMIHDAAAPAAPYNWAAFELFTVSIP